MCVGVATGIAWLANHRLTPGPVHTASECDTEGLGACLVLRLVGMLGASPLWGLSVPICEMGKARLKEPQGFFQVAETNTANQQPILGFHQGPATAV